jgi:bifunctional DNase/RNase
MADDFRDLFQNWRPGEGDGKPEHENRAPRALKEKEVKVLGLWAAQDPDSPDTLPESAFVLLRDNRGRRLPIVIGPFETMAIQNVLLGTVPERPLTHDLLRNVIERLGARVDRVVIDDLWQRTYYARIAVTTSAGTSLEIDSRPSDAIALALRAQAPLYVAEDILEQASRDAETFEEPSEDDSADD